MKKNNEYISGRFVQLLSVCIGSIQSYASINQKFKGSLFRLLARVVYVSLYYFLFLRGEVSLNGITIYA